MRDPISIILIGGCCLLVGIGFTASFLQRSYVVTDVVRGDALTINRGGNSITVKVRGVHAPPVGEKCHGEPIGQHARDRAREMMRGQNVDVKFTGESYRGMMVASVVFSHPEIDVADALMGSDHIVKWVGGEGDFEPNHCAQYQTSKEGY